MRILIAEDDPISRRLLEATLRKWGYDLVICTDGADALAHLESKDAPEIAILDWMMPGVDGVEVCRRIRQKPISLPVYILLLTAKGQREDIVTGLQAGADDYVTKPFHQQELYARLQAGVRISDLQQKLAARVQDLEVALSQLRLMQQSQKLEAIGRLASGVAHEINTPIQYVGDNIRFLQTSWQEIQSRLPASTGDSEWEYVIKELPFAIDQSLEGVHRVSKIVRGMRDFARPATNVKSPTDINRAIESTITVSTTEWKNVAEIETVLETSLPPVKCLPGEIHQVLLSIIVNAADAIADQMTVTRKKGTIRITTSTIEDCVEIRVSDTGTGIQLEHRSKIFEPFFTTKDVGKGTGQGLALAHTVIVQQHGGKIWFETETGKGTTFVVQLPIGGNEN
ncbi:MAG TPA: response regulator [Terriglobia bacterium]|nr:response regulator [Terriglobia bacterium]